MKNQLIAFDSTAQFIEHLTPGGDLAGSRRVKATDTIPAPVLRLLGGVDGVSEQLAGILAIDRRTRDTDRSRQEKFVAIMPDRLTDRLQHPFRNIIEKRVATSPLQTEQNREFVISQTRQFIPLAQNHLGSGSDLDKDLIRPASTGCLVNSEKIIQVDVQNSHFRRLRLGDIKRSDQRPHKSITIGESRKLVKGH